MCPIDYSNYPDNWKTEIRPAILERAGNECEWCGVRNEAVGRRDIDGVFHAETDIKAMPLTEWKKLIMPVPGKPFKIVLTIAHLDHNTTNNDHSNLRALCQKCHNSYDADYRKKNRAKTMREKHEQQTGQLRMFD